MSSKLYAAAQLFTGESILKNVVIEVVDNTIVAIKNRNNFSNEALPVWDGDYVIAPAFIDIQLYGAYGRLLSILPDKETIEAIYQYSKKGGASHCIPTVATNSYSVFFQCIDAVRSYWDAGGNGVLGLHVEGPWISKTKKGAHIEKYIFSPTIEEVKTLLNYGKDVIKIITLAPEEVAPEIINYIQEQGIIVSVGHSNADYNTATNIINECNIPTATHLYNAMSPLQHRSLGIVGAIFDHGNIMCSIVPDGHHVDFAAIRIAKRIMKERLFAITDAVTETTKGDYQHYSDGDKYTANGTLSGSALTMIKCLQNLVIHVGIELEEALRMCSLYPAKAIGMNNQLGTIKVGSSANFLILDKKLQVIDIINA